MSGKGTSDARGVQRSKSWASLFKTLRPSLANLRSQSNTWQKIKAQTRCWRLQYHTAFVLCSTAETLRCGVLLEHPLLTEIVTAARTPKELYQCSTLFCDYTLWKRTTDVEETINSVFQCLTSFEDLTRATKCILYEISGNGWSQKMGTRYKSQTVQQVTLVPKALHHYRAFKLTASHNKILRMT